MSLPSSANPFAGSPQFCIDDLCIDDLLSEAIYNDVDDLPFISYSPSEEPFTYPVSHASQPSPTPCPTPSPALSGITLTQTPSSCEASLPSSPEKKTSKLPRRHSTRKNSNHVPRPCNKFILFRSFYIKENLETLSEIERDHSVLSKMAGQTWNRMTEKEKEPWADLAKERDRLHKKQHPDYRYSPKRRARPTRRTNRNGRDSAERIEKIAALLRENRPQEDIVATVRAIDEELASRQAGTRQADAPQAASSSSTALGSRSADDSESPTKVDPVFIEPVLPPAAEWAYAMSPDIVSSPYFSDSLGTATSSFTTPWSSPFTPFSIPPPPMSMLFPTDTEFTAEFTPIVDFPLADQFGFEDTSSGSYSGFFEQGQYMPTPEESLQVLFESTSSPVLDSTSWPADEPPIASSS
ncbi:hypothetical protein HETIRDRAFT_444436 [Heterobasidion irregulare TC 32-1]|uniref:HMG box domain-containing protein n=1 Tax=Heterobasidion irregulare (strain TC 32-1) TaxID=747525 RepID=W4KA27_HETIT|nr:uncharacterized protein HETIRDRAFT_444436 [Heterobasidion irregulare TC 32-1]ETW82633.1 hypothetical protein HETIRDRAFT_444436 [Heterobasidion irregulare TC 32-1]